MRDKKSGIKVISIILGALLILGGSYPKVVSTKVQEGVPKNIVATFNGNSKSRVGVTWTSEEKIETPVVQVANEKNNFNSNEVIEYKGFTKEVKGKLNEVVNKEYYSYKAVIRNLEPNCTYYYRVGCEGNWSGIKEFTTNGDEEFTFLYTSDTQGEDINDFKITGNTLREAKKRFPESKFWVVPGDIVNAGSYEEQWDWFFKETEDTLSSMIFVPAVGNHEGSNSTFARHFNLNAVNRDEIPKGTVYSFNYGEAHFMVLNTEVYKGKELEKEINWLKKDIKKSDKKWNIVIMHKGIYSIGSHINDSDIAENLRPELTKVFDELGIDLVLQGHDHVYARSKPLKNGKVTDDIIKNNTVTNPKGTIYITNNTAGFKFYNPKKEAKNELFEISEQPGKQVYTGIKINNDELKLTSYLVGDDEIYDECIIKKN